jgi:hypothetical protein
LVTRILILTGWVLVAVGAAAWHFSYGPVQLKLDSAARELAAAERAASEEDFVEAVAKYDRALAELPAERKDEIRKIRLQKAKAQMLAKQLPEAHADLRNLLDEINSDKEPDAKLLAETRAAYANSQYYMTWLMRLEGLSQDVWEPEVESCRQNYKLLAEQAEKAGNTVLAQKHKEDLEAAIRLARMDLGELQGLPLPSQ